MKHKKNCEFFLIILFSILTTSCKTLIKSRAEIISIDSRPRGVKVFRNDEVTPIGKTPFFHKTKDPEGENYTFYYKNKEEKWVRSKTKVKRNLACGFLWTDPMINKVPILGKGIGKAIDAITPKFLEGIKISGGMFECASLVRANLIKAHEDQGATSCPRYIVVPPKHTYKTASRRIMKEWEERVFNKKKKPCETLVTMKEAEVTLNFLNMDHLSKKPKARYINFKKMATLGERFDATHLIWLHFKERENGLVVEPEIRDIHTRASIKNNLTEAFDFDYKLKGVSKALELFTQTLYLIPNSFSLKFHFQKKIGLEPEFQEKNFTTKDNRFRPFPRIKISNIDYPHQDWAVNFRYNPTLSLKSFRKDYKVNFFDIIMSMKMAIHTPVGALAFRTGFGGSNVRVSNGETGYADQHFVRLFQYGIQYYTFVTERYFVSAGFIHNRLPTDKFVNGDFRLRSYTNWFFRIGVYSPELKKTIQDFLFRR